MALQLALDNCRKRRGVFAPQQEGGGSLDQGASQEDPMKGVENAQPVAAGCKIFLQIWRLCEKSICKMYANACMASFRSRVCVNC